MDDPLRANHWHQARAFNPSGLISGLDASQAQGPPLGSEAQSPASQCSQWSGRWGEGAGARLTLAANVGGKQGHGLANNQAGTSFFPRAMLRGSLEGRSPHPPAPALPSRPWERMSWALALPVPLRHLLRALCILLINIPAVPVIYEAPAGLWLKS